MSLTQGTVVAWLRSYAWAWETYDPDAIAGLFTEDATYRCQPWLDGKDPPGTYEGRYEPIAIEGDLAVANGWSRYFKDASKAELVREYDNLFLIRFDGEGRCRSFREWYMGRRGQPEPTPG